MDDFAAVPTVMLGTMTFGDTAGPETAADIVAAALDAGVRWFDTANSYSDGESERILGRLLAGRDDVLIATKVGQPQSALGTEHLLSAELVRRSVDDSLSRLGRDSVDVLYLHRPDRSTPIAETLGAVAALIEAGKVGRLGISNYAAWQIAQVAAEVTALGIPPLAVSQQLYNAISRRLEEEYQEYAVTTGLATVVYNPLAGGLLTGRYRPDADAGTGRFGSARNSREYRARYWDPRFFDAVDALQTIADGAGMPLAQLAMRWLVGRPAVQSVLVGGSRADHVVDNLNALALGGLPRDVSAAVDEVGDVLRGPMPSYNR